MLLPQIVAMTEDWKGAQRFSPLESIIKHFQGLYNPVPPCYIPLLQINHLAW